MLRIECIEFSNGADEMQKGMCLWCSATDEVDSNRGYTDGAGRQKQRRCESSLGWSQL